MLLILQIEEVCQHIILILFFVLCTYVCVCGMLVFAFKLNFTGLFLVEFFSLFLVAIHTSGIKNKQQATAMLAYFFEQKHGK